MALEKIIRQPDGITTSYHRIWFTHHTINKKTSVAVLSYIDDLAREEELNGATSQPYHIATTYETAYDESMTIEKAYAYLKTLPEFEGALDV